MSLLSSLKKQKPFIKTETVYPFDPSHGVIILQMELLSYENEIITRYEVIFRTFTRPYEELFNEIFCIVYPKSITLRPFSPFERQTLFTYSK